MLKPLMMKPRSVDSKLFLMIIAGMMTFSLAQVNAQENTQMVRLAKLVIDPSQLNSYKAILKEEIEASLKHEPGVLTLYAVSEKENINHITILEIYASKDAYQSHLKTRHFLKYKSATKDMVKSLELAETVPLIPGMKVK